ncbi:hypothetical protein [Endozoicomonas sp. Mp262]|uniref:hypothetical protein n=1 Tax=Endozoicomonas sp. Mp262 TaxID=2919499 RepID=UPI0021DADF8A
MTMKIMSHDPSSPLNPNRPAANHNTPSIVFFIFLTQLFLLFPWQKVIASGKKCNECLDQNFTWHQGHWLCNKCFTIYTEQAFKTLPPSKKNTITSALDTLTQQVSKMSFTEKAGTFAAATVVSTHATANR